MSVAVDCQPDTSDEIRPADEIARRALALFGAVAVGLGAPRDDMVAWLEREDLWKDLTPNELEFLSAQQPTRKQIINASWQSESLVVLLWALRKIDALPAPNEQLDTRRLRDLLPPFAAITAQEFIQSASRRDNDELDECAEELMQQHWEARDAKLHDRPAPHLDIEITQERHHGINWVTGYDGAPWDEVTTDT